MIGYDLFSLISIIVATYPLSEWGLMSIAKFLIEPYEYRTTLKGRLRMFVAYLVMCCLLLVANLSVISFVRGQYQVLEANSSALYILSGVTVARVRFMNIERRKIAFRYLSIFCSAFLLAMFSRIGSACLLSEGSMPLAICFTPFSLEFWLFACLLFSLPIFCVIIIEELVHRKPSS